MPTTKLAALSAKNRYTVVLDDDPLVAKIIQNVTGIPCQAFSDCSELLARARQLRPMAYFIDAHVGEQDGIEIVPEIKRLFPTVPVIVITSDLDAEVLGRALEFGADDFVKKPINGTELVARFKARLLSLRDTLKHQSLRFGDLSLDLLNGRVSGNGKRALLSPLEGKLLGALVRAQGEILPRQKLKEAAWGRANITDNALNRKIHDLRAVVREVSQTLEVVSSYNRGFAVVHRPKRAA
ncbi:response regulator transcription factor [bacterium]|nr:response regulator transcription factor [bacterium]